jgi:hypothetical protein
LIENGIVDGDSPIDCISGDFLVVFDGIVDEDSPAKEKNDNPIRAQNNRSKISLRKDRCLLTL